MFCDIPSLSHRTRVGEERDQITHSPHADTSDCNAAGVRCFHAVRCARITQADLLLSREHKSLDTEERLDTRREWFALLRIRDLGGLGVSRKGHIRSRDSRRGGARPPPNEFFIANGPVRRSPDEILTLEFWRELEASERACIFYGICRARVAAFAVFKVIRPARFFAHSLSLPPSLSVCLGALACRHLGKRIAFCGSRWKVLVPLACKAKEPRHAEFYSELNHDGTQFLPGKRFASVSILNSTRFFKCTRYISFEPGIWMQWLNERGYIEYQFIKASTLNLGRVFCSLAGYI
jgi:hypothetical protein